MNLSLPKITIAILFGIIFLLGGAGTVSANFTFTYALKAAPTITKTSFAHTLQTECETQRALFAANTNDYLNVPTICTNTASATTATSGTSGAATTAGASGGTAIMAGGGGTGTGTTGTASGYYFRFHNKNVSPIVYQVSSPYTTFSACTDQQNTTTGTNGLGATTGFMLDNACASGTADQQQSGVAQAQAAVAAQKDSTLAFLFKSVANCSGFMGCTLSLFSIGPMVLWYFIYLISSGLLMLGGYMFDYALFLSLDKNFIVQPFIDTSWTIIRDFSNMLFIFILLYTGIQTMLGTGKDWRGVVIKVVVVALLINFSLFFTKVVIDVGNVLATGVYESMGVTTEQGQARSLSGALVGAFEPQKFTAGAVAAGANGALIIFVIATIINGVAAWAFFTTALIFVGRLMAFWFLMIISPFAFISIALPKGNIFGWWSSTLLSQTFLAPVFLFCVYLLLQLVNGGVLSGLTSKVGSGHGNISDALIAPALIATLIAFALIKAKGLAKSMAGEFGEAGGKLLSGALATASVGARIGVATAGGVANIALRRGWAKEGGAVDRANKSGVATALRSASFDVRNIGGDNSIFGHVAGGVIKQGVGQLGIGKGVGEGGVKASQDKQDKINRDATLKKAQGLEMTDDEKEALYRAQADEQRAKRVKDEAERKHRDSKEAGEVKRLAEELEAIQEVSKEAIKKIDEAQTAFDAAMASGGAKKSGAQWDALNAAQNAGAEETEKLAKAKAYLAKARVDFANSDTANALKTATEKLEASTKIKDKEDEKVKEENSRRRHEYAEKIEKGGWLVGGVYSKGNTATANKIRAGEGPGKSDIDKLFKEAVAKQVKEDKKHAADGGDHGNSAAKATATPAAHAPQATTHTADPDAHAPAAAVHH